MSDARGSVLGIINSIIRIFYNNDDPTLYRRLLRTYEIPNDIRDRAITKNFSNGVENINDNTFNKGILGNFIYCPIDQYILCNIHLGTETPVDMYVSITGFIKMFYDELTKDFEIYKIIDDKNLYSRYENLNLENDELENVVHVCFERGISPSYYNIINHCCQLDRNDDAINLLKDIKLYYENIN